MPTSKILSFENGVVDPSLRYKTNLPIYSTSLSKGKGFLIRKSGGASNRSGFKYVSTPNFQDGLTERGRFRIFGVRVSRGDQYLLMQPSLNGETAEWLGVLNGDLQADVNAFDFDLTAIKQTQLEDLFILSNGETYKAFTWVTGIPFGAFTFTSLNAPTVVVVGPGTTVANSFPIGATLIKPVMYRIYAVFKNGDEVLYLEHSTYTAPSPSEPTDNNYTVIQFNDLSSNSAIKYYNVYRASRDAGAANAHPGNWGLVGRIPRPPADASRFFADFIQVPDITNPPPEEDYLYGIYVGTKRLTSARWIGHYQQRRTIAVNPDDSLLEDGTMVNSKLGAPNMLDTGVIFTPVSAFDYSLPIGIQKRILGTLELERQIVFTEDAVTVIRGGDQGILTPDTINPQVISYAGCSRTVHPVSGGSRGYFMSKNNEKLMMIQFGLDNIVEVIDVSVLSGFHIERYDVVDMAVTKGKVDTLWLLLASGTMVSIVIHEDGRTTGWTPHETDGFIESLAVVAMPRENSLDEFQDNETYDSLFISVIRDGVRMIEHLTYREDRENLQEQWLYVDSHSSFGNRLKFLRSQAKYDQDRINLTTGTTWDAGEEITITALAGATPFTNPGTLSRRLDVFYTNSEGKKRMIRFTPTVVDSTSVIRGVFDGDVPAGLQDLETLAPSDKEEKQTRWLFADDTVTGLGHLANKEVSVFADGEVVASPNPEYGTLTVDGAGELALGGFYNWGVVGLPYESELETLDLDTSDNRTLVEERKLVNSCNVALHETRGGFYGQTGKGSLDDFGSILPRTDEELEDGTKNINEALEVKFATNEWEKTGRVLVKQVDPLPMTVLAIYPKGISGG